SRCFPARFLSHLVPDAGGGVKYWDRCCGGKSGGRYGCGGICRALPGSRPAAFRFCTREMTGVLHIAVCDPNAGHRAALCDALAKLLFDTVDYRFACFAGGEELLAALEGGAACQLVFLEVRLGGALNGLETAGLLRYRAPQADIIFLTRLAEHIGDGYRYHAFDFLIKPEAW